MRKCMTTCPKCKTGRACLEFMREDPEPEVEGYWLECSACFHVFKIHGVRPPEFTPIEDLPPEIRSMVEEVQRRLDSLSKSRGLPWGTEPIEPHLDLV